MNTIEHFQAPDLHTFEQHWRIHRHLRTPHLVQALLDDNPPSVLENHLPAIVRAQEDREYSLVDVRAVTYNQNFQETRILSVITDTNNLYCIIPIYNRTHGSQIEIGLIRKSVPLATLDTMTEEERHTTLRALIEKAPLATEIKMFDGLTP